MPDSWSLEAERAMQPVFRKSSVFSSLALFALVLLAQVWLRHHRPPLDIRPALAKVEWLPIAAGPMRDSRARLAGAWELRVSDARAGGFSGLAVDRGRLLALTDSGLLVWLPRPPSGGSAMVRPLPAVAGRPLAKIGRDSEALARDPGGSGWWVAFEQRHQLILYDAAFSAALGRVDIPGRGWRDNRGIEAIAAGRQEIAWIAESTGVSDAANLPDGRILRLVRGFGPAGFAPEILGLPGGPLRLPLRGLDNAEGMAVESIPDAAVRLWVITDNDWSRWRPTRLYALDLVQAAAAD